MNTLGERIRYARKFRGITQTQITEACGISSGNLSGIENNKVSPTAATLFSLKRILQVSVDWLLTGEGDMLPKERADAPPWRLSDYQKDVAEREFGNLLESQVALINAFEKLTLEDKDEIWALIDLKLKRRNLSSNSQTSKDGSSGSKTA